MSFIPAKDKKMNFLFLTLNGGISLFWNKMVNKSSAKMDMDKKLCGIYMTPVLT